MEGVKAHNLTCTHGFIKDSCSDCSLNGLCMPIAMDIEDVDKLDSIIQPNKLLHAGEHLYRDGDKFTSIYAVRSGSIKTYMIDDDGVEQVTGFYLPGEMLGFDGIASSNHGCNVVAMETSSVCEIPFNRVEDLSREIPILQHHFFQMMSKQIETNHAMMLTLNTRDANGKIATLLLSLSNRFGSRNLSTKAFRLPMSRMDVGNFLGLRLETVSRTFSHLHKTEILDVDGREIEIKDYDGLEKLCHKDHD